jgi:hypothetical protein
VVAAKAGLVSLIMCPGLDLVASMPH